MKISKQRATAILAAGLAGVVVYFAGGLLAGGGDAGEPPDRPAATVSPPATDHQEMPQFNEQNVPPAVERAAAAFVDDYAALVSCQEPDDALSRLQPRVSDEIYFQLVESSPKAGGAPCIASAVTYTLFFRPTRRGWQVAAQRSDSTLSEAVYFEMSARGVVRRLEDPQLIM